MYRILVDGNTLYDTRDETLIVGSPRCKLEANTIGEASFLVYSTHKHYGDLKKLKSVFEIKQSEDVIFRGRMTRHSQDFDNSILVDLEGVMGFLNDSQIPPFKFPEDFLENEDYIAAAESGNVVKFLLGWIIEQHNSMVQPFQRLRLGNVTVTDPNNYITRESSERATSWEIARSKLFESALGGYLCPRYENGGTYIDYLADFELTNSQPIRYGKNLIDFKSDSDANEIYSAIIPEGAISETDNKAVTLTDLPDGNVTDDIVKEGNMLYSISALEKYGFILAPPNASKWEDVTEAENLQTKAAQQLAGSGTRSLDTFEIKAVDLNYSDEEIASFRVYRKTEVDSEPHGLKNTWLNLTKMEIDILNPQNTDITIGDRKRTLTEQNNSQSNKIDEANSEMAAIETTVAEAQNAAKKAETDAMEAVEAAKAAKDSANKAIEQAATAKDAIDAAVDAANTAYSKAEAVEANLENINTEISTVKEDAVKMREDLEGQLETYKTTASQTFATKTDVSTTETTLRQEYQESIAGLQLSFSQDYAKKTELEDAVTDVEARLQSQITVNADTIQTTVSSVESMRVDITNQNGEIAAAQKAATDAQTAADEAKTQAQDAADAAQNAQNAAANAQVYAAQTEKELQEAKANLAEAENKLAEIEGNVNVNAEDIAAAKQAVKDAQDAVQVAQDAADQARQDAANAQTAADQAKEDAADANVAAKNAQDAADEAKEDLLALNERVVSAETTILQHSEELALKATETDLQAVSTNLSNNYYTKTQTDAEIKEMSDSISLSVSNVQNIVTATQKEVAALAIGGRNILRGTGTGEGWSAYTSFDPATREFVKSTTSTSEQFVYCLNEFNLEANQEYVLSFEAKQINTRDSGMDVYILPKTWQTTGIALNRAIRELGSEYTSIVIKFTPLSSATNLENCQLRIDNNGSISAGTEATIWLKNIKLEKGNRATDWSPAPEDLATVQDLSAAEAKITIVENKITNQVAVTDGLTTKISTLEQTASGLQLQLDEFDGRNLWLNTSAYTENTPFVWIKSGTDNMTSTFGGRHIYCPIPFKAGDVISVQAKSNLPWATSHGGTASNNGKVGFWLYLGTLSQASTGTYTSPVFLAGDDSSTKFTKTYTIPTVNGVSDIYIGFRFNSYSYNSVSLEAHCWDIKLERGDHVTDWTAAPEDISTVQSIAKDAAKTATNHLNFSGSGLIVGDMTASTLGKNILIDSDSVDIRNNTTVLASFGADVIDLGVASATSRINLCGGAGYITAAADGSGFWTNLALRSKNLYLRGGSVYVDTSTQYRDPSESFSDSAYANISVDSHQSVDEDIGNSASVGMRAVQQSTGNEASVSMNVSDAESYVDIWANEASGNSKIYLSADEVSVTGHFMVNGTTVSGRSLYYPNGYGEAIETVIIGKDGNYYYLRPISDLDVYSGSSANPWYKTFTERLEVTVERLKCMPSYENTLSYATNVYVNSAGVFTRTTQTSSRTIKHDIKSLSSEELRAENLYNLDVVQFKYNDGILTDTNDARYGKDLVGFIIEDMNEVYPIAVDKPSDDVKEWSWNAQYLIPPMLKLIQDQKQKIDKLENLVNQLLPI